MLVRTEISQYILVLLFASPSGTLSINCVLHTFFSDAIYEVNDAESSGASYFAYGQEVRAYYQSLGFRKNVDHYFRWADIFMKEQISCLIW